MNIFALENGSEEHLGFILFAGGHEDCGDCIVRALPMKPELFDTEEFKLLANFQDAGEYTFRYMPNVGKLHLYKDGSELFFQKDSDSQKFSETKSGVPIFGRFVEPKT